MTAETDYQAARLRVVQARARAVATGRELQARLAPKTIAQDAWSTVRDRSEALAGRGVEAVRAHPGAAAGAGATAVALLARRPLWRGIRRLFSRRKPAEG